MSDSLGVPLQGGLPAAPLRVEHSSRRRESALRQSLVPSLLAARRHNEAHGNPNAELFEIANVYIHAPDSDLPDQPTRLAIVSGRDFFGIKGVVESLLARLHIVDSLEVTAASLPAFARGQTAELKLAGTHLGYVGVVERSLLDASELRGDASAAELELGVLLDRARLIPLHHTLPPFPAVTRDLSLVVAKSLPWGELASSRAKRRGRTSKRLIISTFSKGATSPMGNTASTSHFGFATRRGRSPGRKWNARSRRSSTPARAVSRRHSGFSHSPALLNRDCDHV